MDNEKIDFTWFYFIGHNKLNLSFHEVGRMTLTLFNKLYMHYKNTFDLEMKMKRAGVGYAELYEQSQKDEEWF